MKNSQRIKYFRRKNNLTLREVGLRLGFGMKSADIRTCQYESGARCMKESMLQRFADIYNVSKGTLSVPDIDSASEMMQLLFALEDYGVLGLNEVYGEFVLRLDASCMPEPETSLQVLQQWSEKGKQQLKGTGEKRMLTLELLKLTDEYVQYKFFPEDDKNNFGIVQVDVKEPAKRFVAQDAKNVSGMYKGMAMVRVSLLAKNGDFPQTSACAWY